MTTLVRSWTRMGPCCSASISGGVHGHPSLMSPDEASPGNGLLLFFRVDDFNIALNRARALVTPARRGAPREPEHSNKRVLTLGAGRILRHHQRSASMNLHNHTTTTPTPEAYHA